MSTTSPEIGTTAVAEAVAAWCAERKETTVYVGVTHRGARHLRAFRSPDAQLAQQPDERSVYEIGSFSKVFTTALLAVMESKGMVSLDDTIGKYLPEIDLQPEIAEITVFDLATHTAGFDRLGKIFNRMYEQDVRVLYLRYKKEDLYEELRQAALVRPRGSGWEYSIIGLTVLGHLLELAAGRPYEELLKELICDPLGLPDTVYELSDDQYSRLVRGYDEKGEPSPLWYWDVMLPQGGLRSTMADLLTFAEANLTDAGPLGAPLRRARETHFTWPEGYELAELPGMPPPFRQALGWRTTALPEGTVSEHGGCTLTYQSLVALHEPSQTGFVVLTSNDKNLDDVNTFTPFALGLLRKALAALG